MKTILKYITILCLSIFACACGNEDEPISGTDIVRTDDFIGRIYQCYPDGKSSASRDKYQLQFFEDSKVCYKYWCYDGYYPETENLFNYEVTGNQLDIDGIGTFEINNETRIIFDYKNYYLVRTDGERIYPGPSKTLDDIIGDEDNPGADDANKANFRVRVSTVTGAGEVNFVIRILDTEKEPSSVNLIYKIGEGGEEKTREARWVGKQMYTSYVIAQKHSYVYYHVKVTIDGKTIDTPVSHVTITN